MNIHRRDFSAQLLGASFVSLTGASALLSSQPANAQSNWEEGTHYVKLGDPIPPPANGGKIEVIEFFWYGCGHCNAFEPLLDSWLKRLPADVTFKKVPVAFREAPFVAHQKIYYALDALGLIPALHKKVFFAIHQEHAKLDNLPEIVAFMTKNNVDAAKFTSAYNSFDTNTKVSRARKLAEAYKIDGVPTLGIHGRYFTSGGLTGSMEKALAVTEFLVQKVRTGK